MVAFIDDKIVQWHSVMVSLVEVLYMNRIVEPGIELLGRERLRPLLGGEDLGGHCGIRNSV